MTTSARLKRHAALVDRMAAARGIDLQETALRGGLRPSDLSDLVLRCAGCTQTAHCEDWLTHQMGTVSETPHYCRNARAFRALAKGSD
ncbi:DUF6455 family protein [uncultured Tateyamaria sp.]|uniref:DUF6455 family protein n=1 Tax=uncultured Tateyamaria sp. TaxID=455651 RepID=UPI0026087E40|nr:DUF6455 family protein [uncultured Tateyamaria sp.]